MKLEGMSECSTVEHLCYAGDVSALCHATFEEKEFSLCTIFAGVGSSVSWFDISTGNFLGDYKVFSGVRIHGIRVHRASKPFSRLIIIHGERRVIFLSVDLAVTDCKLLGGKIEEFERFPRFSHWVLDAHLLEDNDSSLLLVGLSNNSVQVIDWRKSHAILFQVACSEVCLLYSLRFWGSTLSTVLVASGTILNQVLVWPLQSGSQSEVPPSHCFSGHNGSIHRLAWSTDGCRLVSASDDRSACIWSVGNDASAEPAKSPPVFLYGHSARLWDCQLDTSLNLVLTASEDCSCRLWDLSGRLLRVIHPGHRGRGIWRCLLLPSSSLLPTAPLLPPAVAAPEQLVVVTGGADGSIRLQRHDCLSADINTVELVGPGTSESCASQQSGHSTSTDTASATVKSSSLVRVDPGPHMAAAVHLAVPTHSCTPANSGSEYVRCLSLPDPHQLYVGTNLGLIHRVCIGAQPPACHLQWQTVLGWAQKQSFGLSSILSLHVLSPADRPHHSLVVGDASGFITMFTVGKLGHPGQQESIEGWQRWQAHEPRKLLSVFCSLPVQGQQSVSSRQVLSTGTDCRGAVKWWHSPLEPVGSAAGPALLAELLPPPTGTQSGDGHRVLCVEICVLPAPQLSFVACGDQRGNLLLFALPPCLDSYLRDPTQSFSAGSEVTRVSPQRVIRGAHGVSPVLSLTVAVLPPGNYSEVPAVQELATMASASIVSTGRDGCVCTFHYRSSAEPESGVELRCVGVERLPNLPMLLQMAAHTHPATAEEDRLAVGFAADCFVVHSMTHSQEVARVSCGGWKRPHAFLIGPHPSTHLLFVFLKDSVIHMLSSWGPSASATGSGQLPAPSLLVPVLQPPFHGRELHCVRLFPSSAAGSGASPLLAFTGSEDGSLRLTSVSLSRELSSTARRWSSQAVGEHTAACAVRCMVLVPTLKAHVLLSAGSKKVLVAWDLAFTQPSSLSVAWRTTYVPLKRSKLAKAREAAGSKQGTVLLTALDGDSEADDVRYLAVTAWSHTAAVSEVILAVCSLSDTQLSLLALHLDTNSWHHVASLSLQSPHRAEGLTSDRQGPRWSGPVLSLDHLTLKMAVGGGRNEQAGLKSNSREVAVDVVGSGSSDGSVCLWDLTASTSLPLGHTLAALLEAFSSQSSRAGSQGMNAARPFGGPGSQGGKQRGRRRHTETKEEQHGSINGDEPALPAANPPPSQPKPSRLSVLPLIELPRTHRLAVNCVSLAIVAPSWIEPSLPPSPSGPLLLVVSGGEDEALALTLIALQCHGAEQTLSQEPPELCAAVVGQVTVPGAHSSAVKGVWSDGRLLFSVGLDQRLRCWSLRYSRSSPGQVQQAVRPPAGLSVQLSVQEQACSVLDVPEPQALDVVSLQSAVQGTAAEDRDKRLGGSKEYRVAVVGRGMQVVRFSWCPSSHAAFEASR